MSPHISIMTKFNNFMDNKNLTDIPTVNTCLVTIPMTRLECIKWAKNSHTFSPFIHIKYNAKAGHVQYEIHRVIDGDIDKIGKNKILKIYKGYILSYPFAFEFDKQIGIT